MLNKIYLKLAWQWYWGFLLLLLLMLLLITSFLSLSLSVVCWQNRRHWQNRVCLIEFHLSLERYPFHASPFRPAKSEMIFSHFFLLFAIPIFWLRIIQLRGHLFAILFCVSFSSSFNRPLSIDLNCWHSWNYWKPTLEKILLYATLVTIVCPKNDD